MNDRTITAQAAARGLQRLADQTDKPAAMIGFDGFVDAIVSVVDKRHTPDRFDPVVTIEKFGQKVQAAAGKSANFELVVTTRKLGGNGPIMANALACLDLPVTYIGALGYPAIQPVFEDLARRATCLSLADPGQTDALEFSDGKLMLGQLQSLSDVSWDRIQQVIGQDRFNRIVHSSQLIGMVNWTMLPYMEDIWTRLMDHVLTPPPDQAQRPPQAHPTRPLIFIDLADPAKRTQDDLRGALALCTRLQQYADVCLGMNLNESLLVARALGIDPTDDPEAAIAPLSRDIRRSLALDTVVIHPRSGAAASTIESQTPTTARFAGPFVAQPRISTGAGDHFNAGFCLGRLAGLPLDQTLCVGTATSGYYVRHAVSPSLTELIDFCQHLPPPEGESTHE